MKIAVLFDGAGLARLGLEQAGHDCTGYEIDPYKWELGLSIGKGKTELCDARSVDLSSYDAVWSSPPCQERSQGNNNQQLHSTLLEWSLNIETRFLIVENVRTGPGVMLADCDQWGKLYNAAQFTQIPLQNRVRLIGGRYREPYTFRKFNHIHKGVCPCITATEYKGCKTDKRRASRFYGRKLTLEEVAYHQGLEIPDQWKKCPSNWTENNWKTNIYQGIGNGVPVYFARAFGEKLK